MKCQNCGSSDIVAIQGQNFCINCGQMVEGNAPAVVKSSPKATVGPKPSDRAPVAISTAKAAQPAPIQDEPVAVATTAAPTVKISHFGEKPPTVIKSTVSAGGATTNRPVKTPRVVNPASKLNPQQVKPTKPAQTPRPVQAKTPIIERKTPPATIIPDKVDDELKKVKPAAAEPEDIRPHPIGFALKLMAGLSLPIGALVAIAIWFRLDQDLLLYICAAAGLLVTAVVIMSQTALQYGLSRAQDGRPARRTQWWAAARGGFMDVVNVDIIGLIVMVLLVIAGFGLWQVAGLVPAELEPLRWAVLLAGNAVLSWLLIGALTARHIAIPAVVIGGLSAINGTKLGWRTFNRAGGHLIIALAEVWLARLVMVIILVAGAIAAKNYVPSLSNEMMAVVIGAVTAIGIALVLWFTLRMEAQLWLKQYRYWMNRYFPEQRPRLLSGRLQSANRR